MSKRSSQYFPKDWTIKTLSDVAKVTGGKRLPKGESLLDNGSGQSYITVSDMREDGKVDVSSLKKVPTHIVDQIAKYRVYNGDIIISVAGTLGLVCKIDENVSGANLTENANRISEIKVDNLFLFYVLRSDIIQNEIKRERTMNAQPKLALKRIRNFIIPIPSMQEQQKIASILSTWDEAIEKYQNLLEQELRLMHSLKYIFFKEKETWMKTNLKSISRVVTGSTPPTSEEKYYHGNYVWVTPTDINEEKYISDSERKLSEEGFSKSRRLPAGTLLITSIASIGKNAILKVEGSCNQQINAIFPSENHSNEFLYYYLTYHKNDLLRYATTTATAMINKSTFEKIPIYVPELKIQQQIADILSLQDEKISSIRNMIIQLQEQKRGLMQLLLTGKVRV